MKKSIYKQGTLLFAALLLFSLTSSAQEVSKKYHEEYTAGAGTTLDLNNKYGDIVVETWDKDQIVINVKVTIDMSNREKAEKLLEYIDVQFNQDGNNISAKTVIDNKFNFSGWGSGSKKFSIDYNVKMPSVTALNLTNKYGNADLDELKGLVNIDIKYGNLAATKLSRGNIKPLNTIYLAYGKGTIDDAGWLNMTIRYCGSMEIDKCQALLLDSKYSKISIGESSSVVSESKYDNIRIDEINNLVIDNGYTGVTIGTLNKKLEYNGSYGSLNVDRIPAGFESVDVETRYMGVKLGIDESADYKLDAKVSYGGLKYNENNFRNHRRIVENNSTEVSGVIGGEESPQSTVHVVSSYGSVRLY
ncbi:MAG TPA: hypothetical protein VJ963_12775 [Bacteroidales bacterium]|nr:hypothetical protein [Bacteroidales bacterium]